MGKSDAAFEVPYAQRRRILDLGYVNVRAGRKAREALSARAEGREIDRRDIGHEDDGMRITERDVVEAPGRAQRLERFFFRRMGKRNAADIDARDERFPIDDARGDPSRERIDREFGTRTAFGEIARDATHAVAAHLSLAAVGIKDTHPGERIRSGARFADDEDAVGALHRPRRIAERSCELSVAPQARRTFVEQHEDVFRAVHLARVDRVRRTRHSGSVSGACGEIVETACL